MAFPVRSGGKVVRVPSWSNGLGVRRVGIGRPRYLGWMPALTIGVRIRVARSPSRQQMVTFIPCGSWARAQEMGLRSGPDAEYRPPPLGQSPVRKALDKPDGQLYKYLPDEGGW